MKNLSQRTLPAIQRVAFGEHEMIVPRSEASRRYKEVCASAQRAWNSIHEVHGRRMSDESLMPFARLQQSADHAQGHMKRVLAEYEAAQAANLIVIDDRRPVQLTVSEITKRLTERLKDQLKRELEYDRGELVDRKHWLTLEQIFVEKRVYKQIEDKTTADAVRQAVVSGMKAFEKLFVRPMVDEDVTRLLDLRIRRISAYDIEKNRKEIAEIDKKIDEIDKKLRNMVRTTIQYLEGMLKKYRARWPRKTRITEIQAVDKKAVARQNLKLSFDKESGYFGSEVKGELFKLNVSEFENVLAIAKDGTYRVMTAPEKVLFTAPLLYAEVFDEEKGVGFTVVYRDKSRTAFAKRIRIEKFIRNKEYQLIKDKEGKIDLLLPEGETGQIELEFVPAKRQRLKDAKFDLGTLEPTAPTARGTRMAPKPVAKVRLLPAAPGKGPKGAGGKPTGAGQGKLF